MYDIKKILIYLIFIIPFISSKKLDCFERECYRDDICLKADVPTRYIFYDVNPMEGFNLRRDVYRRFATLARHLSESFNPKLKHFKLVLPPWSRLRHWKVSGSTEFIPWSYYFDLRSLKLFSPVIEMYEFFEELYDKKKIIEIDEVYVLKNYQEMFKTGQFKNKMEIYNCEDDEDIDYFYYPNITSKNIKCLKFHGSTYDLTEILLNSTAKTILFTHAEIALHPTFGDSLYWKSRRSIRYNKEIELIADAFRAMHLKSTNEADNTVRALSWVDDKPKRNALGGPYLSVHLRRRDFIVGRAIDDYPSLHYVSIQIVKCLEKLGLNLVFLATDAPEHEVEDIKFFLPVNVTLVRFQPPKIFFDKYKDGGLAIIDQIIAANARYFMGTHESTFTFRIFEEREILGFPTKSTFNVLCATDKKCFKTSVWKIVY